jgi:hypothetical protein
MSASWQKALPVLILAIAAIWVALFRAMPASEQAMFTALLLIYMLHQVEEHLWPGGFRQYANAHVFHSGNDDWPVGMGGVAFVNVGIVWLPIAAAALAPVSLRWLGLVWIGGTLVNGIIHVVTTIRFRGYNPGLATSLVLFLPFTIWALMHEHAQGLLTGGQIALLILCGVLIHIPVAAIFVVPFLRRRESAG